jgi:lysophospholipase L1-like esterase
LPSFIFLTWVASLPAGEFQFKDSDRVALVGSTLIEREQKYGYWELALTTRHPDKNLTFRNLGWSGDTVWGESRVGFDLDNPQKGFERLRDAVLAVKPTVIIVGYGTNESFAGEAGLPRFKEGLHKLLDAFAPTKARIILLSPPQMVALSLPAAEQQSKNLRRYTAAIRAVAKNRNSYFVDLSADFSFRPGAIDQDIWTNGVHFSEYGYWRYAQVLELGLGLADKNWRLDIDVAAKKLDAKETDVEARDWSRNSFTTRDVHLPSFWPHPRKLLTILMTADLPQGQDEAQPVDLAEPVRRLRVRGLPPGKHALKIDGKEVASGSAMDWEFGIQISAGPDFDQAEKLRQAIIEKNQLYFHRYRPQNETYLFGFRKHEQGNNAVEVPQFDALIEAKEKEIAKLRVPLKHTYELIPTK